MTTQQTLPQLGNTVVILGTIKKKELEKVEMEFLNKQTGQKEKNSVIRGSITVEVEEKEKGRTHNHRLEVFQIKADNKVYKGMETVLNEHKVGDFVRATVNVDANDYVDKNEEMVEGNRLQAVFISRVDKEEERIPSAEAKIKVVVENYIPVADDKGNVKEYKVKGFTVGYNGKIIPIHNMVIAPDLAQAINGFYPANMNYLGELSFDVNNYLEVSKEQQQSGQQVAFGREAKSVTLGGKFVNNLEVIGGLPPERQFSPQEMQTVQQQRNLQLEEVRQKHATKKANQGQNNQSVGGITGGGINSNLSNTNVSTQGIPNTMAFGNTGSVSGTSPFESSTLPSGGELPF